MDNAPSPIYNLVVDPEGFYSDPLPFRDMSCRCSTYPICLVYPVGRCKRCGTRPTAE